MILFDRNVLAKVPVRPKMENKMLNEEVRMTRNIDNSIGYMFDGALDLSGTLVPLFFVILIFSALLVRYYANPGTSFPVKSIATLSFCFGLFGIALLPIDLSLTTEISGDENRYDLLQSNWS